MIMVATLSKISCFLPPNPPAGLLACLLNPYWRAIWTCLLASLRPASPFACTACVLVIAFCQDFCLSLIENFALYWQFMTMHHASERPWMWIVLKLGDIDIVANWCPMLPPQLRHCVTTSVTLCRSSPRAGFRHNPNWSHIHPLARFLATYTSAMRLPVEQQNKTQIKRNVETHKYAYTATTQMQRYVTRRKSHAAAQKPTTCRKEFRLCSSSQSCVQNFHTQMFKLFKVFKMLKCSKCVQARNHLFFPCSGKFPQSEDFQPCTYFPLVAHVIKRLHSLLPTERSLLSSEFFFSSDVGLCCPFRLSQWWLLWTFFLGIQPCFTARHHHHHHHFHHHHQHMNLFMKSKPCLSAQGSRNRALQSLDLAQRRF